MSKRLLVRLAAGVATAAALVAFKLTVLAPDAIPVKVATVARGRVEETVTNTRAGTVKARRRSKLSPEVGGRVAALPHPKGDRVQQGDVLVKIDDALQRAQLEVALRGQAAADAQREQACLGADRAARELERNRKLAQEGIVSADLLDQFQSAARTADATCAAAAASAAGSASSVDLARTELAKTVLRSPFDGVVADVSTQVGEWTMPSPPGLPIPPVIDVYDPRSIYISAPMDEVDSARIHAGQPVRVTVDSHPGKSFPGRVLQVAPYVLDLESQNRTVEIECALDDAELARSLLPGTSADVEVILDVREDVLRIPTTALMEGGKALVVEGERLVERAVTAGIKNWDFTEVRSGLSAGERVVTSFERADVKPGARVAVVETGAP